MQNLEKYRKRKREYAKTPDQRKKRTEYMRLWREKNRDKHNLQAKESHHRNKHKHIDRVRSYSLLIKYGITLENKLEMIRSQNFKCKICDKEFKNNRTTHIDHNHKTGEIRGILCHICNTKLGWYELYKNQINQYLNEESNKKTN